MRMSLILAATLALTGTAFAQMAPMTPTGGQFCARGDSGTNKGIETCSFQTMAQCEAAKGPGEKCFPNAQLKSESKAVGTTAIESSLGLRQDEISGRRAEIEIHHRLRRQELALYQPRLTGRQKQFCRGHRPRQNFFQILDALGDSGDRDGGAL